MVVATAATLKAAPPARRARRPGRSPSQGIRSPTAASRKPLPLPLLQGGFVSPSAPRRFHDCFGDAVPRMGTAPSVTVRRCSSGRRHGVAAACHRNPDAVAGHSPGCRRPVPKMAGVVHEAGAVALAAPADADDSAGGPHGAVGSACRPSAAGRSDHPRSLQGLLHIGSQPGQSVDFDSHNTPGELDRGDVGSNCCGDITGRTGHAIVLHETKKAG